MIGSHQKIVVVDGVVATPEIIVIKIGLYGLTIAVLY
jgi:hypothetical protein